jgi:Calcium binding
MSKVKEDKAREHRITYEVVVDAYGSEEQAMGWYYYLEGKMTMPFTATCIQKRATSPLKLKEKVEVLEMAPEEECEEEMFVMIEWEDDELAVPLAQLGPDVNADEETKEAVGDWHYWVARGYMFG